MMCFVGAAFFATVLFFALALCTASKMADEQWGRIESRRRSGDADS